MDLITAAFYGIYLTLTGGLGGMVAFCAWSQVCLQTYIALSQTHTTGSGIALAAFLVVGQAFAALWSFLIVNGAAFAPSSEKKQSNISLFLTAAVASAGFAFVYTAGVTFIFEQFSLLGQSHEICRIEALAAAVQSFMVVYPLTVLTGRR
jgi:hypothetical protein